MTSRDSEGRFVPGKSGNPRGRPRKATRLEMPDLLSAFLEPVSVLKNGKPTKMGYMDAVVRKIKDGVLRGDPRSMKQFLAIMKELGAFAKSTQAHNDQAQLEEAQRHMVAVLEERIKRKREAKQAEESRNKRTGVSKGSDGG